MNRVFVVASLLYVIIIIEINDQRAARDVLGGTLVFYKYYVMLIVNNSLQWYAQRFLTARYAAPVALPIRPGLSQSPT